MATEKLQSVLRVIVENDPSSKPEGFYSPEEQERKYVERTTNVYRALALASELGYECGIRIDPEEPEWPVIAIKLPTGQVSWHNAATKLVFDGKAGQNDTRIQEFLKA